MSCPLLSHIPQFHQNLGHFVTSPSSSHLPPPEKVMGLSMVGGKSSHRRGNQSCTCQALTSSQVHRCELPTLSLDCRPQLSGFQVQIQVCSALAQSQNRPGDPRSPGAAPTSSPGTAPLGVSQVPPAHPDAFPTQHFLSWIHSTLCLLSQHGAQVSTRRHLHKMQWVQDELRPQSR